MDLLVDSIIMLFIRIRAENIIHGDTQLVGLTPVSHREVHEVVCRCGVVVAMIQLVRPLHLPLAGHKIHVQTVDERY